ncbi:MAG: DNA-binding domain-containing protein [Burkholderiales bacterium]|jgi:hypothetical protein
MTAGLVPGALTDFQDGFAKALLDITSPARADIAAIVTQPAFAVYRNTVVKGCIDALQANYPAVTRLVGEEWMRAAAAVYVREFLPQQPMLLHYGSGFADFLARFEPAGDLPYLPGVARLDRYWTEAHVACDEPLFDGTAISLRDTSDYLRVHLQPHAAARWEWFDDAPIYTIWSRNRSDHPADADLDWQPEGALLTRPRDAVRWVALDRTGCAFLDACAVGATIADAAQTVLDEHGNTGLVRLMTTLLEAGAFARQR